MEYKDLDKSGVYTITNIVNDKKYVGSTIMSFQKRFAHHLSMLRNNNHKNRYLQNSWNKYGEQNFKFEILDICEKEFCLSTEQYWLNILNSTNKSIGFNINPLATGPDKSPETIEKRRQSILENYRTGKMVSFFKKGFTPWNKGQKMSQEHCDKLKSSAKGRTMSIEAKENLIKNYRKDMNHILVYAQNNEIIGEWNNIYELSEYSVNNNILTEFTGRFKNGRKGKPIHYLSAFHIHRAAIGKIDSYKGLIFKYKTSPLIE